MLVVIGLLLAVLFLAYSNGANDNFKGVATLFGSGACSYRRALTWATVTTMAGSLLALAVASGLIESFKGKGLVPDSVTGQPAFLLAVSLGAAVTVLIATITGMPVSTTHALTGGLLGAGLVATHGSVRWESLGRSFLLPLILSPVLALVGTIVLYPLFRGVRTMGGVDRYSCICIGATFEPVAVSPNGELRFVRPELELRVAKSEQCIERYRGRMFGLEAGKLVDALHFLSAGSVGFARGLNDTPKIVALLLAAEAFSQELGLALVASVMALGGVINARRVAETMSRKITRMNIGQGFTANFVTSLLVAGASRLGLPVSTTHVSVGALFGIGAVNGTARARVVLTIILAWATTMPLGAVFAAIAYVFVRQVG